MRGVSVSVGLKNLVVVVFVIKIIIVMVVMKFLNYKYVCIMIYLDYKIYVGRIDLCI